ncbi:DUF4190 domain-containing protein [Kitasatospora sp. NPDC101183]|uniref:DUF4190 domain-containing protein n=1 Tax=Kitasatospora sp. NPDC101183 TaxID=3364100 RepID=UPI00382285E8
MSKSELPGPEPESPAGEAGEAVPQRDPRIDLLASRPEEADPDGAPAGKDPAQAAPAPPEPAAPAAPAPAPEPANPWAPPQDTPAPSVAPPQPPPPPLPAGGWASVPPSAQSGLQPGMPGTQPPLPYGQPYGQPYGPPYGAPATPGTNGLAIASLATGLTLLSPVALVLGIVAMFQIKRNRERGRGLAVAGVALGAAGTLLFALVVGAADFSSPRSTDRAARGGGGGVPAGMVHWSDLKTGDCYSTPEGGSSADPSGDETVYWVRKVPCTEAHHGEVAGAAQFPAAEGRTYPGESVVRERASELCRPVLDEYALDQWAVPDGMDDVYLYPTRLNWARGDRYVTCAFEDRDDQHRGTVRTDRTKLSAAQLAYLEAVRDFNGVSTNRPKKDATADPAANRDWARRMAAASRAEAGALRKASGSWSAEVAPKVAKLAAAQEQAASAWDDAVDGSDLVGDIRRAQALVGKTVPLSVDVRRALGLATGEQAPDLRV